MCNFSSQRIPATVSVDPTSYGRAWVLDPYGSEAELLYPNKRYWVKITTGVKDHKDGLSISSDKNWYFTTGSS